MGDAHREIHGLIRGRTVVLEDDPGWPEGQDVTVRITARAPSDEAARDRLRSAAGGWAEDAEELDRYLEWNRVRRKVARPEIGG